MKYLLEAAPAACSLPTRAYYLLTTMASSRRPVPRLPNERYLHKLSPVCLVLTLPTTDCSPWLAWRQWRAAAGNGGAEAGVGAFGRR